MNKISAAFDVTTLAKALFEANEKILEILNSEGRNLQSHLTWYPASHERALDQQIFLGLYFLVSNQIQGLDELRAWVRDSAEELNSILAGYGFSIRLDTWKRHPHKFGVVAILDQTVSWLIPGSEKNHLGKPIKINNRPAFRLNEDAGVIYYDILRDSPLIQIQSQKEGDSLCLVKASNPSSGFDLLHKIDSFRSIRDTKRSVDYSFGGIILPNIILDQEVDVSWLKGLWAQDAPNSIWEITQAKMQAKFALGPEGARAKIGTGIGVARITSAFMPRQDYIVDHDVILWIERESIPDVPLFCAYIPKKDFADRTVKLDEI